MSFVGVMAVWACEFSFQAAHSQMLLASTVSMPVSMCCVTRQMHAGLVLLGLVQARPPIGREETARQYRAAQNTSTVCDIIDTCYMFLQEHQMIGMRQAHCTLCT